MRKRLEIVTHSYNPVTRINLEAHIERDPTYAPEKFTDNYGHDPIKRLWHSLALVRSEWPENLAS